MAGLVPFNRNRGLKPTGFQDFYNMLDDFFDTWPSRTFKIDVKDSETDYTIEAELPGVKKDEVEISLEDGKLAIAVKREEKTDEQSENYIHKETRTCSMQRSVYLADAKSEGVKAKLEDGVLKVTVPKEQKTENVHRIEIE